MAKHIYIHLQSYRPRARDADSSSAQRELDKLEDETRRLDSEIDRKQDQGQPVKFQLQRMAEIVKRKAELRKIIGAKDTSYDPGRIEKVKRRYAELKNYDANRLKEIVGRSYRVADLRGTGKEQLIGMILSSEFGDKLVEAAFQ